MQSAHTQMPLFRPERTSALSAAQKSYMAKVFWHARERFYKFLWVLGTRAPTEEDKEIVLENIRDEFGGNNPSHEHLYEIFVASVGADVHEEIVSGKHRLPFLR